MAPSATTEQNLALSLATIPVLVAALLLIGIASPAAAHLAIRLDLMAPQDGQRIDPPVDVEVVARPMLLGVPQTTFTMRLDGQPLDPATGLPAASPVATPIRVNQTRRIRLGSLPAGQHTLEVSYRPDQDAPVTTSRVTFTVTPHRALPAIWPAAGLAGLLGLAAAGLLARRRLAI